jgi:exportin-2 (importin alpha re-exporter)
VPCAAAGDPEREGVLDGVKAAVCANINLFMEMNEEEFAKYLQTFVTDVWHLLMQVIREAGRGGQQGSSNCSAQASQLAAAST